MLLTAAAQTDYLIIDGEHWQPPRNFVDPVTLKIHAFKTQGLDDRQITIELEKLGMGWYPETGATWIGRTITPEEAVKLPNRALTSTPSNGDVVTRRVDRVSLMRTSSFSWTGVSSEVVCGSMSVGSEQTQYHYVCVQLGDLDIVYPVGLR